MRTGGVVLRDCRRVLAVLRLLARILRAGITVRIERRARRARRVARRVRRRRRSARLVRLTLRLRLARWRRGAGGRSSCGWRGALWAHAMSVTRKRHARRKTQRKRPNANACCDALHVGFLAEWERRVRNACGIWRKGFMRSENALSY